jgi:hypothetical protein
VRILPRDWYFPAARARICRRIASVIILGVAAGVIIGGLSAGAINLDDLALPPRVENPVVPRLVRFPSCDAARAEGAAPLHLGHPGYELRLDADGDGIACEPLPLRD